MPITQQQLLQIPPNAGAKAGIFSHTPGMTRCAQAQPACCGGLAGDLEVKVLYTPGKRKC